MHMHEWVAATILLCMWFFFFLDFWVQLMTTYQKKVTLLNSKYLHSMAQGIPCPVCQRLQKPGWLSQLSPRSDAQSENFLNAYAYHEWVIIS